MGGFSHCASPNNFIYKKRWHTDLALVISSLPAPAWLCGKQLLVNAGDSGYVGSIPCLGRSTGEVATHCSIFAWRAPGTEEPGGLQSVGSQRVGYNLATEQ